MSIQAKDRIRSDERDQLLFDIVSDSLKGALDRKERLDTKASNIIMFVGIITAFFSGIAALGFIATHHNPWVVFSYLASVGFFMESILYAVLAYRITDWDVALNARWMVDTYHNQPFKRLQVQMIKSTTSAIEDADSKNRRKADRIQSAWYLLISGFVMMLLFVILALITG